jgi:HlyD family secretion protein
MAGKKIFRQAVLDRLASPEQLNTLMTVTDPRGWIALLACGLLLATALVWGVLGSIPTRVHASGILIHSAGLAEVVALGAGQITRLEVDVGDRVREGQLIAQVAQPELVEEIEGLEDRLADMKRSFERSQELGEEDVQLQASVSASERAGLQATIAATNERMRELRTRLSSQQELLDKGLVTSDTVAATREQLRSAQASISQMRSGMRRTTANTFSAKRANAVSAEAEKAQIADTEHRIKVLRERLVQSARVVSTHSGRVVELRATVGDMLGPGSPILSLERDDEGGALEALLYVDSREGKKVKPGMEVQVSPTVVRRERHGVLIAEVQEVEGFPSTRRGMMRKLHNDQLVETFLMETAGAPIAVRAVLKRDEGTPSGYRWSSAEGPDLSLSSGTRVDADITTATQRPITLVFPMLDLEQ